ncbi:Ig-like domain-containing protein [Enterobacter ludwigii]|uniref:Ig-like domain-containing protein n=1 Tax=Enterobacter ludwigii TaxID=299767 RepID=UPI00343D2995
MPNSIMECSADPTTIQADSSSASTITALVVDESNNPVVSVLVDWSVDNGGIVEPISVLTNDNGLASTILIATVPGTIIVTAKTLDDQIGKSATIIAEEINMNNVNQVTSNLPVLPSDGSVNATLTAIVMDDTGTPVQGIEVQWAALSPGKIDPEMSVSDEEGRAITQLTAEGGGFINVSAKTEEQDTAVSLLVLTTTPPLITPHVQNASEGDNFTLDSHDIDFGVNITIPAYPTAAAGDNVVVYWGNYNIEFPISNPDEDLPKIIDVLETFDPATLQDGEHSVYYIASDIAGNPSISSGLNITVVNGGQTTETLEAPIIPEIDDNGYINILEASDGVDVEIKYASMAPGDFITLYWPALDGNGNQYNPGSVTYTHVVAEGETSYNAKIALEYFIYNGQGYEGTVDAYYTVLIAEEDELALSHKKHCRIDTVSP